MYYTDGLPDLILQGTLFLKHLNIVLTVLLGIFEYQAVFASSHPDVAFGGQGRRLERKGKGCVSTSNKAGIEGSKCLFLLSFL